uniref:Uncharacterized protein n=1 Tax=Tetradesmus obliquus TaxID=3088 RepID=A0A383V7Q4_TETOB|eukprot:jgi/Sobl393_1/12618/SZX60792.1
MDDDWHTVHTRTKDKKQRQKEKQEEKQDEPASKAASTAADPFAEFDRAFAEKAAQKEQQQRNAFAELGVHEAPAAAPAEQGGTEEEWGSSADEAVQPSSAAPARAAKKQKPKPVRKPKLTVAQVAAGVDVGSLLHWMAEAQLRYSTNETAQVEALSDRLLVLFREAHFDLGGLLAGQQGLQQASQQPICDMPHPLMNALASFVASVGEGALAAVVAPLTAAVVADVAAAAAAGSGGAAAAASAGKSKAGLLVMLAVILRTRPQVLVQASGQMRAAGGQLSGPGRLPVLLWVINQAALAEPAVGVAVWVRVLLPQLLGISNLPSAAAATAGNQKHSSGSSNSSNSSGAAAEQVKPLEASLQGPAVDFVTGLLEELDVPVGDAAGSSAGGVKSIVAAEEGADVACEDAGAVPTVPGAAVEALSRSMAGKLAAATASSAESKKSAAARAGGGSAAAAAAALAPLLPSLAALAAGSSCPAQYGDWLLLALESAALSDAAPGAGDALVMRSAAHAVACLQGSAACFSLWESKHKSSLRGSARILAALQQRPALLQPLLSTPRAAASLQQLLAALPARHHTFLATSKGGWQGACARVADDACSKLARKLPRGRFRGGAAAAGGGGSSVATVLGLVVLLVGLVVVLGLYRLEVAGIVQAYAGKDAAQQLDAAVLAPLAVGLQQLAPFVQQAQQAAAPLLEPLRPVFAAVGQQVERAVAYVQQQLDLVDEVARKNPDVDISLFED